jgi:TrmH family RNA methyltransferase
MTITSPHNERLKELRKLARRRVREQSGRFVAEGEDLLAAAQAAGWPALERYVAAGSGLDGVEVEPDVLAASSQLGSGTRALAVYQQRWAPEPLGPLCVALYGIADPGNVGTILRSALAFGAASVALGPDCADPYGPKAVRASMGALFAVPLAPIAARTTLPGTTIALDARADETLADIAAGLDGPLTLLVGAERTGLPAAVVAASDRVARIPIASESLNAAMAATVALYEVSRSADAPDHRMRSA